jgi:hypothetical protein
MAGFYGQTKYNHMKAVGCKIGVGGNDATDPIIPTNA